jgi:hypothetical protein
VSVGRLSSLGVITTPSLSVPRLSRPSIVSSRQPSVVQQPVAHASIRQTSDIRTELSVVMRFVG